MKETRKVRWVRVVGGTLRVPSEKSLTHRALLFGGIASGPCRIQAPLWGEDCQSTAACLRQLGVGVQWEGDEVVVSPREWSPPDGPLDCGNSGTTMRLLLGLLASRPLEATLVGDASLSRRPMGRVGTPLREMGARFEGERPPVTVHGGGLRGIRYASPVASAQVKSAVLLAGLRAEGETTVTEPALSRDHTERLLRALGVDVRREGLSVTASPRETLDAFSFRVPADVSSAAFFLVLAGATGASIEFEEQSLNPTRTGVLDVLRQTGVRVEDEVSEVRLGEPVGTLRASGRARQPFEIAGSLVPRLVDEVPILAVLATQLEGTSLIRDAAEVRVKETDRIEVMAAGLRRMGATVETYDDGMAITGPTALRGTEVDATGDHRIGMAFAIAGMLADGETTIRSAEAIGTSYPTFWDDLGKVTA